LSEEGAIEKITRSVASGWIDLVRFSDKHLSDGRL
jgi:hypothetical protein